VRAHTSTVSPGREGVAASEWCLRERASLPGGSVAWDRFGEGAAIVLVHGTPSWSVLWRNVAPALAERFSVYLLDLLGYGESEQREGHDVSITAQGRVLAELLEHWELEAPGLVGHDIGAAIVLRAHLVEGRAASRIALLDAVALNPWKTPTTSHIRAHPDAYRTMPLHIYEAVLNAHIATAVHWALDDETLAAYLAPWRGEAGRAAYLRKIAQWTDADVGDLEALLPTLRVPVRILWGEEDRWLDRAVADRLRALVPGADIRLIPDAGHFAPEDAPAAVARELADFFA